MLQFTKTVCNAPIRIKPWRFSASLMSGLPVPTTDQSSTSTKSVPTSSAEQNDKLNTVSETNSVPKTKPVKPLNLASLKLSILRTIPSTDSFYEQVNSATSIKEILDLTKETNTSADNIRSIITSFANWAQTNNIDNVNKIGDSTNHKHSTKINRSKNDVTETSVVYRNTIPLSDYVNLSTPTMIKVIATLATDKNRNMPLLKLLASQIIQYNKSLSVKQCSDILYSMATLSFYNKELLEKIFVDLQKTKPPETAIRLISSIITSLGLLRYKNDAMLDFLCNYLLKYPNNIKPQDLSGFLQTCATLGYTPVQMDSFLELINQLTQNDLPTIGDWIDVVWSLILLNKVQSAHISSLLTKDVAELDKLSISKKLKLLNINGAAKYIMNDYKGPLLDNNSNIFNLNITRSKKRQLIIETLRVDLVQVLGSSTCIKTNVDTKMGFLLDAECHFDMNKKSVATESDSISDTTIRLGIMLHDYHDYCQGGRNLIGIVSLCNNLLKAKGYSVLSVPHDHYSTEDFSAKRIKYLQDCFIAKKLLPA